MYCRTCGNIVHENAVICVKCGCVPLYGTTFCQECGMVTRTHEICNNCGSRLRSNNPSVNLNKVATKYILKVVGIVCYIFTFAIFTASGVHLFLATETDNIYNFINSFWSHILTSIYGLITMIIGVICMNKSRKK